MWSTGVISASDCPFFGPKKQSFDKKPHPHFRNRSFQFRIDRLMCCMDPEISRFSNDTAGGLRKGRYEAVHEGAGAELWSAGPGTRQAAGFMCRPCNHWLVTNHADQPPAPPAGTGTTPATITGRSGSGTSTAGHRMTGPLLTAKTSAWNRTISPSAHPRARSPCRTTGSWSSRTPGPWYSRTGKSGGSGILLRAMSGP